MNKLQEQFRRARKCSTPLLQVRTADNQATQQTIIASLNGKQEQTPLLQWDICNGLRGLNQLGEIAVSEMLEGQNAKMVSARPSDCLDVCSRMQKDSILFLHNLHMYWDDATGKQPIIQGLLNLRDFLKSEDIASMLVALNLTGSQLPAELAEHMITLDDSLPTRSEIAEIISQEYRNKSLAEPSPDVIAQGTDACRGLCGFAAETAIALNMSDSGLDIAGAWDRKKQMIESDGLLQVYSGQETFQSIGGNEGFKELQNRVYRGKDAPKAAVLMDELEKAVARDTGNSTKSELLGLLLSWFQDKKHDGQLLNGAWGSGKTAGVKALGREFKIPVLLFNLSQMGDKFVGESVKRLVTTLGRIDAMTDGKVCVYATTNKLDSLPPELIARFKDAKFFFDLPNEQERSVIWDIYIRKYELVGQDIPVSNGWTGREIEECCYKAYRFDIPLIESAKYITPVSKTRADELRTLRTEASGKFLSANSTGIYRFDGQETVSPVSNVRKYRE